MMTRTSAQWTVECRHAIAIALSLCWLSLSGGQALAQRVLGADISYWNRGAGTTTTDGISQANWNTAFSDSGGARKFVFIRASRGGTTGVDQPSGTPGGGSSSTLSKRYDDPDFFRNITRATNAGMLAGPYHFGRPDVAGNTGTDEANHFMEAASAWMRPGYLMPVYDFEAGSGADTLAQFAIDFSNRIYSQMQIRPAIYIGGSYSSTVQGATLSRRNQLAKPATYTPSVVGPAYPMLWNPRYVTTYDLQNDNPKDTYAGFYGPWDDYGDSQPWAVWQYSSTQSIPGFNAVDSGVDGDVSHGDIEYMKDFLVPAVWWNDSSGDWGTMTNWNSGQPIGSHAAGNPFPTAPYVAPGQAAPMSGGVLPVPRLPGTGGSGPAITSGVNDTIILERPNANITVTLSSGSYNIRKMYMRETLNITGGTLTINYDPNYNFNVGNANAYRSGPISAQFSGPVTLSGTGSLSVNTLQVDASKTFTLAGSTGTLTFKQINLLSSAKIAVTGDVNINPLSNNTATISGSSGNVDLSGGTRTFTVGNGNSDVDLDVVSPVINGGLTKNGAGTMRLSGPNTFTGPVTVNGGVLRSNNAVGFASSSVISVNSGGTLQMNGITDTVASLGGNGGTITQGAAGLTLAATSGSNTFAGTITGTGSFTKNGAATQILSGNNSLGAIAINAGSLLLNGTNTTGAVTVGNTATLGGTGSVTGAVTANNGGHIAPGASIESLDVGALTLNGGSVLDIELGAPGISDLINVTDLVTLSGGSVNLIDLGLDAGMYTLIDYGTLSGSIANLGTPIGGPSNFNYALIDTGGAINLSVSIPGDFNLDGTVDGADYLVWRKGMGTTYDPGDYDLWRANYGRLAGSGSGASLGDTASVPEPATLSLVLTGLLLLLYCKGRGTNLKLFASSTRQLF